MKTKKVDSSEHKTKSIVIKSADVDQLMIPFITWMNAFESVYTTYCCQGNPDQTDEGGKPYVSFLCSDSLELIVILALLEYTAKVQILWSPLKTKAH
jgi:hypothetical protein